MNNIMTRWAGMLAKVPSDELGEVTVAGPVPRLTRTPAELRHAGRRIGQDTRDVLAELCGYSQHEVRTLEKERIVCSTLPQAAAHSAGA